MKRTRVFFLTILALSLVLGVAGQRASASPHSSGSGSSWIGRYIPVRSLHPDENRNFRASGAIEVLMSANGELNVRGKITYLYNIDFNPFPGGNWFGESVFASGTAHLRGENRLQFEGHGQDNDIVNGVKGVGEGSLPNPPYTITKKNGQYIISSGRISPGVESNWGLVLRKQ